jgi:hypothetical protein
VLTVLEFFDLVTQVVPSGAATFIFTLPVMTSSKVIPYTTLVTLAANIRSLSTEAAAYALIEQGQVRDRLHIPREVKLLYITSRLEWLVLPSLDAVSPLIFCHLVLMQKA